MVILLDNSVINQFILNATLLENVQYQTPISCGPPENDISAINIIAITASEELIYLSIGIKILITLINCSIIHHFIQYI